LSEETVKKLLKDIGLTDKETEVYIFLAKHGALKGSEIANRTKKHKAQIYSILKNLQSKGLVESTLEFPARFAAVPFETVINLNIKAKHEEAAFIENAKQEILNYWKSLGQPDLGSSLEKFVVIEGNNKIYNKVSKMIAETKNVFSANLTVSSLLNAYRFDLFDATPTPLKGSKTQFRFIIEFSENDLNAVKTVLSNNPPAEFDFKGRTPELGARLSPRIIIRDDEELLLFVTPKTDSPINSQDETCLWTNCKALVQSFMNVFKDMWQSATNIGEKITEIEAGKISPKAFNIGEPEKAKKVYDEAIQSAKDEVITIISIKRLASTQFRTMAKEWVNKGITVKILVPLRNASVKVPPHQIPEVCEIRYMLTDHMETLLIDAKQLIQFTKSSTYENGMPSFENMIFVTDYEHLKKTKKTLDEIWEKAYVFSKPTFHSIENLPMSPVALPDKTRWVEYGKLMSRTKDRLDCVTEKEVLAKIINARRIRVKTWNDPIIFYGSNALAIIHPPEVLGLPDLMLNINHNNKNSSWGAEDLLIVSLLLESAKGPAYVPVAVVTDNPRGLTLRKQVWKGTPVAQNFIVVKKDEFQIQVQGNTLFAVWTIPIQLFPAKYVLPPASILFEGYGKLVSGVTQTVMPSGRKVTKEYNGLEAFVTFYHPDSKYIGPGTDGLFARDDITTSIPISAIT
jgi:sugar-specific transcriptional regulator TrmB